MQGTTRWREVIDDFINSRAYKWLLFLAMITLCYIVFGVLLHYSCAPSRDFNYRNIVMWNSEIILPETSKAVFIEDATDCFHGDGDIIVVTDIGTEFAEGLVANKKYDWKQCPMPADILGLCGNRTPPIGATHYALSQSPDASAYTLIIVCVEKGILWMRIYQV